MGKVIQSGLELILKDSAAFDEIGLAALMLSITKIGNYCVLRKRGGNVIILGLTGQKNLSFAIGDEYFMQSKQIVSIFRVIRQHLELSGLVVIFEIGFQFVWGMQLIDKYRKECYEAPPAQYY